MCVTFPDGTEIRSDGAIDAALTTYLGRDVTLTSAPPEGSVIEGIWPRAIEGLAPFDVLESMSGGLKEGDDDVAQIPLSFLSPPGTFFDVTTLHVLTTATLDRLAELEPDADFDVRRFVHREREQQHRVPHEPVEQEVRVEAAGHGRAV